MARLTKRQKDEVVEVFYGIDPTTHEVVSVSRTRGGILSRMGKFGPRNHLIHPSNKDNPRVEVIVVWHLTDVISFAPIMLQSDFAKADIAKLEAKAAELRKAAETAKASAAAAAPEDSK